MSAALSHNNSEVGETRAIACRSEDRKVRVCRGSLGICDSRGPAPSPAEQFDLIGTDVAFPRNGQFYGEGDTSTYLYRIESGVARSYRMTADGRRQIVAFYVSGDFFGFEVGDTHTLSTEAVTDVRVRLFKLGSLLNTASRDDDVAHRLWLCISCEVRRNQEHILQLGKTVPCPRRQFSVGNGPTHAARQDAVALSISRLDIADYLDLRIETVSRILMQLARSGAIALSSNRKITIRNRTLLTQLLN